MKGYSGVSALLTWDDEDVSQPSDYMVFRAEDPESDPLLIGVVPWGEETFFVDPDVESGVEYSYRVAIGDSDTFVDLGGAAVGLKTVQETRDLAQAHLAAAHGDHLYTMLGDDLVKFDISQPGEPVESSRVTFDRFEYGYPSQSILDPEGEYLYLLTSIGFAVMDVRTDSLFMIAALNDIASGAAGSMLSDFALRDRVLYIAAAGDGVIAYDVANPAHPHREATYRGPEGVSDLGVYRVGFAQDHLYVRGESAADYSQISVIVKPHVSRGWPSTNVRFTEVCSSLDPSCWPEGMGLEPIKDADSNGRYAVGTVNDGLTFTVLDVSDPARPRSIHEFWFHGYEGVPERAWPYHQARFDGRYMYLGKQGVFDGVNLAVFDLASASAVPRWITGTLREGPGLASIAHTGDEILVADSVHGAGRLRRIQPAINGEIRASVTWDHDDVGGSVLSCPAGDGESLIIEIQLDGIESDDFISSDRITVYPAPDGPVSLPDGPAHPSTNPTHWNDYTTSITIDRLQGCGIVPFVVALDGEVVGFVHVDVRSMDTTGNGSVDMSEISLISGAMDSCDNACFDFNGDGCVDLSDISIFSPHIGHTAAD